MLRERMIRRVVGVFLAMVIAFSLAVAGARPAAAQGGQATPTPQMTNPGGSGGGGGG